MDRRCGDCQECCILIEADIFGKPKPADVPCWNLCKKGCSIYESRPDPCREFKCFWLRGHFSEEHKPNKSGMIIWGGKGNRLCAVFKGDKPHKGLFDWLITQGLPVVIRGAGRIRFF